MSVDFFINKPFMGVKVLELLSWRDLEVVDEKANFFVYAKTEALLAVLCVAEVVELVARVCFAIVTAPYFLVTGKPGFQLRRVMNFTVQTFVITASALYFNLFSQLASVKSAALVARLFGEEEVTEKDFEIFTDIKKNKEKIKNLLTNMPKSYVWSEEFVAYSETK